MPRSQCFWSCSASSRTWWATIWRSGRPSWRTRSCSCRSACSCASPARSRSATLRFAAVGATAFGHFADSYHIPWLLTLLLATLVAVPVGAIVSIPAIRLSGLFLALATLGFGILLQYLFYSTNLMFGLTTAGIPAPRPQVSMFGLSSGVGQRLLLRTVARGCAEHDCDHGDPAQPGWVASSVRLRTRRWRSRRRVPRPTSSKY